MANPNEFKVTTEELTTVANGIRFLLGQNSQDNPYEWTTDYVAYLGQISTILSSLDTLLGDGDGQYDEGPAQGIQDKIEELQDRINDIIDPNDVSNDSPIFDAVEEIEGLITDLDNIIDHDPSDDNGSLESIVDQFVNQIDTLEEVVDPAGNTEDQVDQPFEDTVEQIVDAITDLRDIDRDPDDPNPDERTLDEVVDEIEEKIEKGHLMEDILDLVEELIEYGQIASDTDHGYRPIVNGEEGTHIWDNDIGAYREAHEDETPTHVIAEEYEFFAEDHDIEHFREILEFIEDKADEAFEKVEEVEEIYAGETEDPFYRPAQEGEEPKYVWDDEEERYRLPEDGETPTHVKTLNEAEELAILLDDLLDAIENITAQLNEYRYGDFQIIEVTTEKTGTGITDLIQNLETARRDTMSNDQKEIEKTVVYVSRCLFNSNDSFICSFLVNGIRKEGVFIWKNNIDTAINQSVPNEKARLSAGKYLIRIVLKQIVYYWHYDTIKGRYIWKTIASHLVPEGKTIETVTDLPASGAADTYYLISK